MTRLDSSRSGNDSLMSWMSTTPRSLPSSSPTYRKRLRDLRNVATISGRGVVRAMSATSRRMMSETLRLASAVASGVASQTMPADRRLATYMESFCSALAAATARTETTIIGTRTAEFCVSSNIMITARSGARVTPASMPPMPRRA